MEKLQKMSEDIKNAIDKALSEESVKNLVEATQKATGDETGSFEVIITTEDVDRMGEVIRADGWKFENYMKNPIVLWGHDYHTLPIGVTDSLTAIEGGKILAKGRFAPETANPFAQQIRRLYDLGIVRATSVGFIPTKQDGNVIIEAELLEYSFVSVPANPMALSTLVKSGFDVEELVTKGILSKKEEVVEEKPEEKKEEEVVEEKPVEEKPVEEVPVVDTPETVVEESGELKEAIVALSDAIKVATLVLEKLGASEHKEETSEIQVSDIKAFEDFKEKRRILQIASTVIADVLAEARRSINTR